MFGRKKRTVEPTGHCAGCNTWLFHNEGLCDPCNDKRCWHCGNLHVEPSNNCPDMGKILLEEDCWNNMN